MNGQNQYAQYIDSTEQDFKARYIAHCMGEAIENFKVEYVLNEYQYTLYYYDQGGNLVKTVPPQGVNIVNLDTYGQDIKDDRAASTVDTGAAKTFFTSHTMATRYTYNTLNQLIQQITPDGDTTRFWYDPLGRIVLSQNGNQEELISSKRRYSYTKYDEQGRIEEVGELSTTNDITAQSYSTQQTWLADANFPDLVDGAAVGVSNPRYQVTKTYYDATTFSSAAARMPSATQSNLRKRVVSAALYPYYAGTDTKYTTASHYSYDIHGNVKELVQEDSTLRSFDDAGNSRYQSYKTFEYTYDLVSGNVNMLAYQHGQADAFYYRYEYDADNRVTAAYTHAGPLVTRMSKGSTGVGASGGSVMASSPELWDRDAKYFYYQHGPLARTEVGHNKVQASDYAYTLHGWIKGVNSNALTSVKDMGNDAHTDVSTAPIVNRYVGGDKYGYQLTYYDTTGKKDYTSITTNAAFASQTGSSLSTSSYNLWNGNIKNMVTSISSFMPNGRPQARAFTYDQLNRIKVAQVDTAYTVASNSWTTSGNLNQWKETFLYDHNGNIKTLVRHGKSPTAMDSMTYNYNTGRNQLNYVDDAVLSGNYGTDIDDQSANNYIYDSIGNLTKDVSEQIDSIIWNVYGKIDRVVRSSSSAKSDLEFRYDAMGNRICKIVKPRDGISRQDQNAWTYTYYMRDASGNVIATYNRDYSTPGATYGDTLTLTENHLYGSSRVGIRSVREVQCRTTYTYVSTTNGVYSGTYSSRSSTAASTTTLAHELRRKAYELSNHLGNVLVTVSDARFPQNSGAAINTFAAVVLSAQDYYAFGSSMVGRTLTTADYRYTFNGKEKDAETELQDYGMRIYNERLGRFLSVDPLTKEYPELTPYQFASNRPIDGIDLDGMEYVKAEDAVLKVEGTTVKVNPTNYSWAAGNIWSNQNNNPQNWERNDPKVTGNTGSIGISTEIGQIYLTGNGQTGQNSSPAPTVQPVVNPNDVPSAGPMNPRSNPAPAQGLPKAAGAAAGIAAVNIINFGLSNFAAGAAAMQNAEVKDQFNGPFKNSMQDVNTAVTQGLINDPVYQSAENLASIAYYVYCGVNNTTDQKIVEYGTLVLNQVTANRTAVQVAPAAQPQVTNQGQPAPAQDATNTVNTNPTVVANPNYTPPPPPQNQPK